MWDENPIIFDGEDEAALKDRFVELCAKYYPNRSEFEIGEYTFKGLRDASSRGQQAGKVWMRDLEILERIDEFRRIGGHPVKVEAEDEIITKAALRQELLVRAREADDKESVAFYKLLAETNGWIVKQVDANINDKPRVIPTVMFKRYEDNDANEAAA